MWQLLLGLDFLEVLQNTLEDVQLTQCCLPSTILTVKLVSLEVFVTPMLARKPAAEEAT